ncbi:YgaP family membrane protein [Pseudomonas frederiksbergensis]|uniref:YgaP family membrane protein n=1 Tax=Pseudomonas frederiksbergensis TaxID=104087 RepID=UPI003D01B51F
MSELKRVERIESTPFQTRHEQNVEGWERIGSLAGGVVMVGKGLRRGGVFGLIQVAIGGVALARGITGHSSVKSLLEKSRQDMNNVRAKIQRAGEELNQLKANAEAATKTATGTGNDSLKSPKSRV